MEVNPYAPPQSNLHTEILGADAERIRKEHLSTESSIKTLGIVYYLGSALCIASGGVAFLDTLQDRGQTAEFLAAVLIIMTGIALAFSGYGARRLRSWSRWPILFFSFTGLIAFPIGTIICAYIIYIVLNPRGKFVTTPEYQKIIAATPNTRRSPASPRAARIATIIVFAIMLLFIITVVIGLLM